MTELTKTLGIRLNIKDKEELSKHLNRDSAEGLLKQIRRGEIILTSKGAEFMRVNTEAESVNTNDCDNCPYMSDLDTSKFDEVCEFKGIDRQRALDKCVSMLWR